MSNIPKGMLWLGIAALALVGFEAARRIARAIIHSAKRQ